MWVEEAINEGMEAGFYLKDDESVAGGMPLGERASDRAISNYSVYQKNEVFLEVCGQFEAQRGLLGFATAIIPIALLLFVTFMFCLVMRDVIRGSSASGAPNDMSTYIGIPFVGGMLMFLLWLFRRIAMPLLRKDYFKPQNTDSIQPHYTKGVPSYPPICRGHQAIQLGLNAGHFR